MGLAPYMLLAAHAKQVRDQKRKSAIIKKKKEDQKNKNESATKVKRWWED